MSKRSGTRKIGRSAITGKFMPLQKAMKQKRTSIAEIIKKPKHK